MIARPGHPAIIVQNASVKVMPDGASQPVQQEIGGWVVMPREHFETLMKAAQK